MKTIEGCLHIVVIVSFDIAGVWLLWSDEAGESPSSQLLRGRGWELVAESSSVSRHEVQRSKPHHRPRTGNYAVPPGLHSIYFYLPRTAAVSYFFNEYFVKGTLHGQQFWHFNLARSFQIVIIAKHAFCPESMVDTNQLLRQLWRK